MRATAVAHVDEEGSLEQNGGQARKRLNQTSFEVDELTRAALEELKKVYGVSSNAAVMKRAVRIALIASRYADENKDLHLLIEEDGAKREVIVPQLY
jgi:hypothetical protein